MITYERRWVLADRRTRNGQTAVEPVIARRSPLVNSNGEQKKIERALAQMVTALREPGKHPGVEVIFLEDA